MEELLDWGLPNYFSPLFHVADIYKTKEVRNTLQPTKLRLSALMKTYKH